MGRGVLTEEIKAKSLELMGYEISVRELRLMPYVDYTAKNSQILNNVNDEEEIILQNWIDKGFIFLSAGNLSFTKDFYNILQELLWLGHVDYA